MRGDAWEYLELADFLLIAEAVTGIPAEQPPQPEPRSTTPPSHHELRPACHRRSSITRAGVGTRDGGVRADSLRPHKAGKGSALPHKDRGAPCEIADFVGSLRNPPRPPRDHRRRRLRRIPRRRAERPRPPRRPGVDPAGRVSKVLSPGTLRPPRSVPGAEGPIICDLYRKRYRTPTKTIYMASIYITSDIECSPCRIPSPGSPKSRMTSGA